MSANLLPGDRCYIKSPSGRRMRGVVADFIPMAIRGESGTAKMIPFRRNNGKVVMWVTRKELRKLPARSSNTKFSKKTACINRIDDAVKQNKLTFRQGAQLIDIARANRWRMELVEKEIAQVEKRKAKNGKS